MPPRLARVVAVLSRAPGKPEGDTACVLKFQVPLTPDGQLDPAAFPLLAAYCRAELIVAGTPTWSSPVLRTDQGWAVRPGLTEEGPFWHMTARTIRPGEYLTLFTTDAGEQAFRIVNVERP
ncbi:MAG: hypothetical protein P4L71_22245 [Acetobacteraceae bacterium]|nr:hypothetical protein [Acetobacteraceae bacterium]